MSAWVIHWARPDLVWVLGVWAAVAIAAVLLERRGSGALDRLVASALQPALVARPARWRRVTRLALLVVAGGAMAAALLQPQMGERFVATPRVGAEIMIALDVSRSMLADDAAPSRLERAKAEVRDLLAYLRDDHVGLIAFAGRASVLSPMTPDKSFLRLALDGAGPHSVPRGGTKLAESIRRAVTGFGEPGPSQRALILITDGEDHDSFAVDAARAAAEAGIKIIAIGFGDEGGSPIFVRDPESGAREQVRDGDGRPVISRLNGDLLRELALATDGAYVPAGTGVLDLASIYDAHIAGLTRGEIDEQGRTIRDEAYQLFVAIALVALVAAVFLVGTRSNPRAGARDTANLLLACLGTAAIVAAASLAPSGAAWAEASEDADALPPSASADPTHAPLTTDSTDTTDAPAASSERDEDPRARFNRGNAALAEGEPIAAATAFRAARRDAPDDPELRYAATYNLGFAAMARADAEETPEASLAALHEAADWFREAVALRADDEDPRHNLEVALRRALILADEIAQAEKGDLETVLDGLIERQRAHAGGAAQLLGAMANLDGPAAEGAIEHLRPAFDAAATDQRVLRAEADELAERVVRERDAILQMAEDARSPEDSLRAVQLEGVLVYVDAGIERMGGARRQLRLARPERAYRRAAAALGELKRARDQLRDPVQQIDVLIAETGELVQKTAVLLASSAPSPDGDDRPEAPAFLTPTSLGEDARRLADRVGELAGRLAAAAADAANADPAADAPPQPGAPDPEVLRQALAAAAPLVGEAASALEDATASVVAEALRDALSSEASAGRALADAQEHFFDLARLLAVTHEDEAQIAEIATTDEAAIAAVRDEYAPLAAELQAKNLARARRLEDLLARERAQAFAAAAQAGADAPTPTEDGAPTPAELEKQRFDAADALLAAATGEMEVARLGFEANALDWASSGAHAVNARDHLEALRSLFYSLVEHLQALARDQVDLSDETNEVAALSTLDDATDARDATDATRSPESQARAEALAERQAELEPRAGGLADVLLEQSQAPPPDGVDETEAEQGRERLRRAAEHVAGAQLAMGNARAGLADEAAPFETIQAEQTVAVEELAAAIELLSPPPPPEDQPQQDQEQDESESPEGGEEEKPEQGGDDGAGASDNADVAPEEGPQDPGQLLQGVRDREAERRRDRERARQQRRAQPVDRDW